MAVPYLQFQLSKTHVIRCTRFNLKRHPKWLGMQPNPHQVRATATFKTHTSPLGAKGKNRLHFGSLLVLQLDVWHSIANIHSHPEDAAPQTSNIQFCTTGIKCELTEALFSQMYLYVTGKLQLLKAFSPSPQISTACSRTVLPN